MKCFDVVQAVLDATYEEVPDSGKGRDHLISNAIKQTSKQYGEKLMSEGGPNFSKPEVRFGYVFSYVPAHAHWLYALICDSDETRKVLKKEKVRISCLGGGPGSDIVGVLKYLDVKNPDCKLFAELVDGCVAWKATWGDLAYELDLDGSLHTDYVIHDVGDTDSWGYPTKIGKADIVTLSFFVSEIYHLDTAAVYLSQMLSQLKPGALVLVNDNKTPDVWNLIDHIAENLGLETIHSWAGQNKIWDSGEELKTLQEYTNKFGSSPKLTGMMFSRVYLRH